jgi:hypothetical protein
MSKNKIPFPPAFWLAVLMVAYAVLGYVFSLTHMYEQKTLAPDLAAFSQVMHNIVTRGIPFSTLIPPFCRRCRL